ncbi:hypothetical protein BHE74_00036495, partial [Ensete ventricosum]
PGHKESRGQRPRRYLRQASPELGRFLPSHPYHPRWYLCSSYNGWQGAVKDMVHFETMEILRLKHRIDVCQAIEEGELTA